MKFALILSAVGILTAGVFFVFAEDADAPFRQVAAEVEAFEVETLDDAWVVTFAAELDARPSISSDGLPYGLSFCSDVRRSFLAANARIDVCLRVGCDIGCMPTILIHQ